MIKVFDLIIKTAASLALNRFVLFVLFVDKKAFDFNAFIHEDSPACEEWQIRG